MKVNECMSTNVICADTHATVYEIAKLMSDNHIGCIPICDFNKNIVGLVTDRDITLRSVACGKDANNTKVTEIMTTNVYKVNANDDLSVATNTMTRNQVKRVPVIQDNTLVGIITLSDLANNTSVTDQCITNTVEGIYNYTNGKNNM